MEKQETLFHPHNDFSEEIEILEGRAPEIKVIKNTYISAGALIREMIIKKTWIIPLQA